MSERSDQVRSTCANYACPSLPTYPALPEKNSDSPSTPTSSTSTREPAPMDGTPALIRQEHDYGCGIASLAMITGQTYDDVRKWLIAHWPGGTQTPDEWLTTRGIHKGIADFYLAAHGYMWRTLYGGWKLDPWPPEPFAPVHLVMVRQPSGNSHYVVMRDDGAVLDPLSGETRSLGDWPAVDNVQGVWPSPDERPKDGEQR